MGSYRFRDDLTERQRATFAERLLRLREVLLDLPKSAYDHSTFVKTCGTASCALGWAAASPQFRGLGLRIEGGELVPTRRNNTTHTGVYWAAEEYFGETVFNEIFATFAYYDLGDASRDEVAERIVTFVAERYGYEPVRA